MDLFGEPDGSYSFSVRQTDLAGNTSAAATSDYTLDTDPPGARDRLEPAEPRQRREPELGLRGRAGGEL